MRLMKHDELMKTIKYGLGNIPDKRRIGRKKQYEYSLIYVFGEILTKYIHTKTYLSNYYAFPGDFDEYSTDDYIKVSISFYLFIVDLMNKISKNDVSISNDRNNQIQRYYPFDYYYKNYSMKNNFDILILIQNILYEDQKFELCYSQYGCRPILDIDKKDKMVKFLSIFANRVYVFIDMIFGKEQVEVINEMYEDKKIADTNKSNDKMEEFLKNNVISHMGVNSKGNPEFFPGENMIQHFVSNDILIKPLKDAIDKHTSQPAINSESKDEEFMLYSDMLQFIADSLNEVPKSVLIDYVIGQTNMNERYKRKIEHALDLVKRIKKVQFKK